MIFVIFYFILNFKLDKFIYVESIIEFIGVNGVKIGVSLL